MALTCLWGSRPQHQKRTHAPQQKWARYSISSTDRAFPAADI
jgi:hypothetical protein